MKQRYCFLGGLIAFVAAAILVAIVWTNMEHADGEEQHKSLVIGESDFFLHGERFQYVAGSFHYFRALRESWRDRLLVMKSAGITVVDTYVEWATHNPEPGVYTWDGVADLEHFLALTQELELYVILRPGPYICAERDNGGLPYWLFSKHPGIRVRTSDGNFLNEVEIWYAKLFERVQKKLLGQGGNIIMVQVENEYGAFAACDKKYLYWLRDETLKYVHEDALLFTVDMPYEKALTCGAIENVFVTTDFGIDKENEIDEIVALVRKYQPTGPIINSEFYPGWLTYWQRDNERRSGVDVARVLKKQLAMGFCVNIYVFFGGTNFGFNTGSSDEGPGTFLAGITSYDYDAPMDEAGDATEKLLQIRDVITAHFPQLNPPEVPQKKAKMGNLTVNMKAIGYLMSAEGRAQLASKTVCVEKPISFEEFGQFSGFLLYEATLPAFQIDPVQLTVTGLADRALVYVDDRLAGVLSRRNEVYSLPLNKEMGTTLRILVENQGRSNWEKLDDVKGILGSVSISTFDAEVLQEVTGWSITGFPLTNQEQMESFLAANKGKTIPIDTKGMLNEGPAFFYGEFVTATPLDTYLDTTGWGKGSLFVNGFNLGRYWPVAGPQMTLFVPKEILRVGNNEIVLLELQSASSTVRLLDYAILDSEK